MHALPLFATAWHSYARGERAVSVRRRPVLGGARSSGGWWRGRTTPVVWWSGMLDRAWRPDCSAPCR